MVVGDFAIDLDTVVIGAGPGTFLLPVLTNIGGAKLAMLVCAIVLLFAFIVCLIWAPETSPKFIKAEQNNN